MSGQLSQSRVDKLFTVITEETNKKVQDYESIT